MKLDLQAVQGNESGKIVGKGGNEFERDTHGREEPLEGRFIMPSCLQESLMGAFCENVIGSAHASVGRSLETEL